MRVVKETIDHVTVPARARPFALASAYSPRPTRLGLLARSREALKAFALMTFALLTLGLLCAPPAQAQGGWAVNDKNGNPITPDSSGYPLKGIPTGSASNTYPADMTAAAMAPGYYDPQYGWVDNSQWLQAGSGGPHSYDPNPLGASWLYTGGPGSLSTSISLNTTAGNVAGNNYSGAFNKGRPPFFTDSLYQNTSDCEPLQGSATGAVQGTLWAYWTWMGSGQAPDHLNILLTTNVASSSSLNYGNSGQTGGLTATAQASDGNPFNESASVGGVPLVIGHHLLRVPVSSGSAVVSLNGNVQGSASNSVPYGAFGSPYYTNYYGATNGPTNASSIASVSGTAAIDSKNKEVNIIPTMGTTYHKGVAGLPQANVPDSNGTVTDDTIAPPYSTPRVIQPNGMALGSWSADSGYVWSQRLSSSIFAAVPDSRTLSGVIGSGGAIPAFVVQYYRYGEMSNPIQSYIHLVARDSGDGATAAADYNVKFHNEYENKIQLTDGPVVGPWIQVSGAFQSSPQGGNFPLPVTGTVSVTVSITPGGGVSNFLAQAYDVPDVGATYSSPPHNAPLPMPPNQWCWIVDQSYFEHIIGTVDNYEASGFQSMISWTIDRAYHPGNPLVDYNERLVSSDSPPTN